MSNKKNGGIIPPVNDERVLYVPVGCGKCIECTKQKSRNWQVRLTEDIRHNTSGKFVTLTFTDESLEKLSKEIKNLTGYNLDNATATLAVRRFLERYRKKNKKSLRHWLITELGHTGTERIHLHGIIWTNEKLSEIENYWQYGYMWKGKGEKQENYVSERTINYITKYITKIDTDHKEYQPKILTSPGIGGNYIKRNDSKKNKYVKGKTNETYRTKTGTKLNLPIYYRNKIYNEEEREKLWLEKLDKQERWVCGEKIDTSKDDKDYWNILEYHRKRNKQLGYGTDEINWERKIYEQNARNLKKLERINKQKL